jgi:uncharacterized protein
MNAPASPIFEELDEEAIRDILARNNVGRIAFSFRDRVDVEPIHYVYHDGWLYMRTSPGRKALTLRHNRWVAFEVDEVEDVFWWRSVVVQGPVYILNPSESPQAEETYFKAVELLRGLVPETLSVDDPVPDRDIVFRLAVQTARGLASWPGEQA